MFRCTTRHWIRHQHHPWHLDNTHQHLQATNKQDTQLWFQQHNCHRLPITATYSMVHNQQQYGPSRTQAHNPKAVPYNQPKAHLTSCPTGPTPTAHNTPTSQHTTPVTPQTQVKAHTTPSSNTTPPSTQAPQDNSPQHVVPNSVAIPPKWTPTADCYYSNTNLGVPVYRVIQPTAWSRRRGLQGQDPLSVPMAALARYGAEDHSIRLLSQGKFTGIVPTRTVAESVFLSQMIKSLRDHNVDLDMAAEIHTKDRYQARLLIPYDFSNHWSSALWMRSRTKYQSKRI